MKKYFYINTDKSTDIKDAQLDDLKTIAAKILGVPQEDMPKYNNGADVIEFDIVGLDWDYPIIQCFNYLDQRDIYSPYYVSESLGGLQDWLDYHKDNLTIENNQL